ncbi:MAG: type II toxin-antitoxin system prevent-host-death family antitoxin [Actinomycetota bacterium]
MKFKSVAELHNKTTEVLNFIKTDGYVVITNHGKPQAVIKKISENDIEDFILENHLPKTGPYKENYNIGEKKETFSSETKYFASLDLKDIFKKIVETLKKYNPVAVRVFGSFARGDFNNQSDIDLVVKFSDRKSLLDLVKIEFELQEKTGFRIDLLTENSLTPYFLKIINKDLKTLYEKL